MSVAEKYYTDTARIKKYLGINDRGDTSYGEEMTILCRFCYEQKEVLDSKANKVLSTANMLCGVFIPALSIVYNDVNERFTVKACEPVKSISGKTDHYEVTL